MCGQENKDKQIDIFFASLMFLKVKRKKPLFKVPVLRRKVFYKFDVLKVKKKKTRFLSFLENFQSYRLKSLFVCLISKYQVLIPSIVVYPVRHLCPHRYLHLFMQLKLFFAFFPF